MKRSLAPSCVKRFSSLVTRKVSHIVWQKCFPSLLVSGAALSLAMVLLLIGGCVSQDGESPSLSQIVQANQPDSSNEPVSSTETPNAFEVVDCLLPGQVRRLGAQMVYMTQRRPVRATVEDCVIRGGEYVSYDRSDLETSLKVWRKAAESGNADAQYYVGTLYERGVAGKPDFAMAVNWYQKAAEQDHRQAAMNLGRLYDQGLGVPKNHQTAFIWVTKASGLKGESLTKLLNFSATQEIQTLQETVGTREEEIRQLQKTVSQAQEEKARLENQLAAQRTATQAEKDKLNRLEEKYQGLQQDLQLVQSVPDREPEIQSYQAQLQVLQDELVRRQQALQGQDQTIAVLQEQLQDLSESQQQTRMLENLAETRQKEAEKVRMQLLDIQAAMATVEEQLTQREQAVFSEKQKVKEMQDKYQNLSLQMEQLQTKKSQEQQQLIQYQREYEQVKQELQEKRQQLAQREAKLSDLSKKLESLESSPLQIQTGQNSYRPPGMDLGLEGPSIQIIDPPLIDTRGVKVVSKRRDVYLSPSANRSLTGRVLAPAGLWELRVNGMVIDVDKNGVFSFEFPMIRTQENATPVDLVAVDIQNKRSISSLNVVWGKSPTTIQVSLSSQSQKPFGQYYALVIGNDHYQHWEPLKNAIADAEAVGNLLGGQYGFQVKLLKDATRKDILKTLNEFRKILTERDNLLIFYAGHGFLEPNIDRGYWIPVDAELQDNSDWVLLPTITDLLQLMSAKHILIVADSCFAGKLTRSSLAQLRPGLTEEARMDLLQTLAEKRVRTALTSGGVRPVLDAGGKGHSIFTEAFLNVLKENVEILETERIFLAVRNRVMKSAKGLNTEQIPTYSPIHLAGHESLGDFIFVPTTQEGA
jgi:hypothetical protein